MRKNKQTNAPFRGGYLKTKEPDRPSSYGYSPLTTGQLTSEKVKTKVTNDQSTEEHDMSNTTNKLENDMDNSVKALQKCYRRSKLDRFDKIVKTELENKIKTAKEKIEMHESKIRKLKEGLDSDIQTLKGFADFRGRATAWINEIRTIIEKHPSITIEQFHDNDWTTEYDDVLRVYCTLLEGDSDPYDGQHACYSIDEALERCIDYAEHFKQLEEV
jgi:hypothetical protein